jgi:hypothetical protein
LWKKTDLLAYGKTMTSHSSEVVESLQALVLTWQAGLHSMGGALKPKKCSWSLLSYKFIDRKPTIETPHACPAQIFLQTPKGIPTEIKRVPALEGIMAVGVVQVLNGKMKPQVNKLKEKVVKWATRVKEGWMDHPLAWTCLRTMIWPSLAYPLRICSMSKPQGNAIVLKFYQSLLPELGL